MEKTLNRIRLESFMFIEKNKMIEIKKPQSKLLLWGQNITGIKWN